MNIILQHDQMDCGVASLAMVSSHYGKSYNLQYLREYCFLTRNGVSLLGIIEAAEKIGFETYPAKMSLEGLHSPNVKLPLILHWNKNHFVVLYKISRNIFTGKPVYKIADPGHGFINLSEERFKQSWLSDEGKGIGLFLNPTEKFYQITPPKREKLTVSSLMQYLTPYKKQIAWMSVLLLMGSCLTLIFPFLTEALIDRGVNAKNLNFIFMILLAQLGVFLGSIAIEIFRNWLMLYVGTKLSITIISDFLGKLLQLPIKFFDSKMMGDFQQRIQDNERIEQFLTSQSLTTFFSIITFSVFFGVLWYYDFKILLVYLSLTVVAIFWSLYWLRQRKMLDYFRFQQQSENQESIYEIIGGITEMKLNNFEAYKRRQWEGIQEKLFKTNIRLLKTDQLQSSGFEFINQVKNILVTFLAATYVVQDSMTLGALLSVSYIIGQMNSPVNQLLTFFRSLQDAKLSLERLNEVQNHPEEEKEGQHQMDIVRDEPGEALEKGIRLQNVSFQYEGPRSPYVLKDIDLFIPEGKITAIVGASGSGKTTLMKLLLKFYAPTQGNIYYNQHDIEDLSPKSLRQHCGVVMQDGYIFSDSIARNIATDDEVIDDERLGHAVDTANIRDYIESLPLKYSTKIGASGNGISGGQQQRFLIARSVYKNPQYIFFDEATSALDAENEKIIHDRLQQFFKGKTVLLIAHRLSTVKNAHQIVVLKGGEVVEKGNHEELVARKGEYFNLIKNQLELGA
ncbi:MAG: peptidase domain-containing ABC transporter [Saprospiraceae bacterium]|nr:peptidase domain-containing ABC transporter [Saprospiraceae bacterium]